MNVILITPDQLRADHMSCYGYSRKTTPNIDALAAHGALFSHHYAVGSWTTPSFVSMLSSLTPSKHGATLFGSRMYDSSTPLFPQRFEEAGFKTVAFCNNGNAAKALISEGEAGKIPGFQECYFGEHLLPRNITEHIALDAPTTTDDALMWLDRNHADNFFLWLLYIEPHSPYNPPPEHDIFKTEAYPDEYNEGYSADRGKGHLYRQANAGDADAVERLNGLYDGKIHFIDHHVGRLLRRVKELDLQDCTLIVLTSDHGELLYEHDDCLTFDHRSLYDADTHVPLIITGPSIPASKTIDSLVNQLDLGPTILDVAGLPPLVGAQGSSAMPLIQGKATSIHQYVFAEQDVVEPLRSVRDVRHKLIYRTSDRLRLLYDTVLDPAEKTNLAMKESDISDALLIKIQDYVNQNEPDASKRQEHWEKFGTSRVVTDDVAIGARLQFFGMSYDQLCRFVKMADGEDHFGGGCYWMEAGDGTQGAVWRVDNPLLGNHAISMWYGTLPGRISATNVEVRITTRERTSIITIDQNASTGQWNHLGTFRDPVSVSVSNKADGPVVVDAVLFEHVETSEGGNP